MASPSSVAGQDHTNLITRLDLRAELSSCFSNLEAPMTKKNHCINGSAALMALRQNLIQVAQSADTVMELELANQDTDRHLQKSSDWTTEKILMLENQLKMDNLKITWFPRKQ